MWLDTFLSRGAGPITTRLSLWCRFTIHGWIGTSFSLARSSQAQTMAIEHKIVDVAQFLSDSGYYNVGRV
jgi:hypothetical protein